ncbi:hypothetical protein HPB49_006169 [Dermacentor silvarum]|uniref:Uncharacterized protein n=1 Tax=Dermacentor silvarum TaxID=543639 RepID=A0ACB8CJI4_DERSI|nr:hypothetical protein HPB49_006169 [Dermacentor silvarum]
MPQLPRGDYKIIIRPRGGLRVADHGAARLATSIYHAAEIQREAQDEDTICTNFQQNIIVVSTPIEAHADKYQKISRIKIGNQAFETSAYESAPDCTSKGVIRETLRKRPVEVPQPIRWNTPAEVPHPIPVAVKNPEPHACTCWTLQGYRSIGYAEGETTALTTLVRRNITVMQHDTKITNIDNIFIELIPQRKTHESLFILKIYSNPKHKKHRFLTLFKRALNIADRNPIIIGGDFNAPHTAWAYSYVFPKEETCG